MRKREKTILCAMSGGVDSSVAALLLKNRGFKVIGIFLNLWSKTETKEGLQIDNKCCSLESAIYARMVAQKLNIKLYTLNFKDIFKKKVVDYFIQSYDKGETPNPCIICNKQLKFGKLLQVAKDLGADKIATGHYAQIIEKEGKKELCRAVDKNKDQSYFLWNINYQDLDKIEFPVGGLTKKKVREIAKKNHLPTHNKKDSQGLCFAANNIPHFINIYAKKLVSPGNVVDEKKNIIGQHKGLAYYTIGQRSGFTTFNDKWRKAGLDIPPLYVKKILIKDNCLEVCEEEKIYAKTLKAYMLNWLVNPNEIEQYLNRCSAQIRYRKKPTKCNIKFITKNEIQVVFNQPQKAITPGQSVVFYLKNHLLGGGIIKK